MQGRELDRDALHARLWADSASSRQHLIEIHQLTLARELNVNNKTIGAALRELLAAGKLRKVRTKQGNIGVYAVRDPA